jgi:hypothetical protein
MPWGLPSSSASALRCSAPRRRLRGEEDIRDHNHHFPRLNSS